MEFIIRECCMDDAAYIQKLNCDEMGYDYPIEDMKVKLEKLLASDRAFKEIKNGYQE